MLNPNSKIANKEINMIIDIFLKKIVHFHNKTGVYRLHPDRFLLLDALNGNSHLWHELYLAPYASDLGFVACYVTLITLNIVSRMIMCTCKAIKRWKVDQCRRSWSQEKANMLFTSEKLREANITQNTTSSDNTHFWQWWHEVSIIIFKIHHSSNL